MKVPCICINGKNRPKEIPAQMWINEGTEYNIVHIYYHNKQGIQGALLEEVQLKNCLPYESYRLDRFAFTQENFLKLIELIKSCTELDSIDINKLLEESNLEILKL